MATLMEEYDNKIESPPTDVAKKVLFAVLDDLSDRRGGFDIRSFDEDVQNEILETNLKNIRVAMS